jgi:ferredoxin-type protein NapH
MLVTQSLEPILKWCVPLTSPFLVLPAALLVPWLIRRVRNVWVRAIIMAIALAGFVFAYHALAARPAMAKWFAATNSPVMTVLLFIVVPAMYLQRGRFYRAFLVLPALALLLAASSVFQIYAAVPAGKEGFYWFLIRPAYLICGVVSLLVLLQPILSLKWFRFSVRLACFGVLVYGGFAFRQDYSDYQEMLGRRRTATPGALNLSDTSPVLQHSDRMSYLPAAPCRFTADGGYVQGCVMEMAQRTLQVDPRKVVDGDAPAVKEISVLGGAILAFLAICFIGARWFCGWLCPLSAMGGVLDWCRRVVGLPHLKANTKAKWTLFAIGITLAAAMLLIAALVPYADSEDRIAGVKIPEFPFCKICPSQQVGPVVGGGFSNYSPMPTPDWGGGFFRAACIGLLVFFGLTFLLARHVWCHLCPMGMISGVFNRGGMFRLVKDGVKCNRCGMCAEVCPMDIDTVREEMETTDVSTYDCVLCLRCVDICPRDKCLSVEHGGIQLVESRFESPLK